MWSEWLETTLQRAAHAEAASLRDSLRRVEFLWAHDIIADDVAARPEPETADETID